MNVKKVIKELKEKYPGKKIILDPPDNATEIICELEPTENHPEYSISIAVIDESKIHYHKKIKETYKVLKGIMMLIKGTNVYRLTEGDEITINPGEIHSVKGEEVWIEVYSKPGWTAKDHILAE